MMMGITSRYIRENGFFNISANNLADEIEALEKEVDDLREDSERLDWLESEALNSMSGVSAKFMGKQDARPLKPGYRIYRYHKVYNAAPTLRAAIDEAMNEG
jgi:hypothetical protein